MTHYGSESSLMSASPPPMFGEGPFDEGSRLATELAFIQHRHEFQGERRSADERPDALLESALIQGKKGLRHRR
jgi:hypothetical protein